MHAAAHRRLAWPLQSPSMPLRHRRPIIGAHPSSLLLRRGVDPSALQRSGAPALAVLLTGIRRAGLFCREKPPKGASSAWGGPERPGYPHVHGDELCLRRAPEQTLPELNWGRENHKQAVIHQLSPRSKSTVCDVCFCWRARRSIHSSPDAFHGPVSRSADTIASDPRWCGIGVAQPEPRQQASILRNHTCLMNGIDCFNSPQLAAFLVESMAAPRLPPSLASSDREASVTRETRQEMLVRCRFSVRKRPAVRARSITNTAAPPPVGDGFKVDESSVYCYSPAIQCDKMIVTPQQGERQGLYVRPCSMLQRAKASATEHLPMHRLRVLQHLISCCMCAFITTAPRAAAHCCFRLLSRKLKLWTMLLPTRG